MLKSTSSELMTIFRQYFMTYGTPEELVTDGGRQFISQEFREFLGRWGVSQHTTSAYTPHSNLLAESGVKTVKRLITDNLGRNGSLDNDGLAKAMLAHRNTPIRGLAQSPAQILFARRLRDSIPMKPGAYQPRPEWVKTLEEREVAMATKHLQAQEKWEKGDSLVSVYLV